jgi:hypothetical protein
MIRETHSRGQWPSRRAALRKEQLEDSSASPDPRRLKTGHCGNRRKKRRDQYDVAEPFAKGIIDVTGTPPRRRSDGGAPVGYLGLEWGDGRIRSWVLQGPERRLTSLAKASSNLPETKFEVIQSSIASRELGVGIASR